MRMGVDDDAQASGVSVDTLLADAERLANAPVHEEEDASLNEAVLQHMDSLSMQRDVTVEVSVQQRLWEEGGCC